MLDLAQIPAEEIAALEKELRLGWELDKSITKARQVGVGRINQDVARAVDGLGALKARIDMNSFTYWGKRLGFQCWDDKQFLKEYLRDNEASRVKTAGTKLQVGYAK